MRTTTLTVANRFAASAERVFDAFLDPEKAAKFMFVTETGQIVRCEIDARIGGQFVITDRRDGEDVAHEGEFLEIDRPRWLVSALSAKKYGNDVDSVAIDIAPLESGCELTLTDTMSVEQEDRKDLIASGWRGILNGLAAIVKTGGLYVEKSIVIDAGASDVWNALTDSELSRQWIETWWPDFVLHSDWGPGDSVVWRMADGGRRDRGSGNGHAGQPSRAVTVYVQSQPARLNEGGIDRLSSPGERRADDAFGFRRRLWRHAGT